MLINPNTLVNSNRPMLSCSAPLSRRTRNIPPWALTACFISFILSSGASRARVHRLMQKYDIHSIRRTAYKITTYSNHSYPFAPNLLQRNFTVPAPNIVWAGDITYVGTDEGWLYLAIVKDLFTKKIVGYAFSNHIDAHLTCAAMFLMAMQRQNPAAGLIFHSDRGSQYARVCHDAVIPMITPLLKISLTV